MKFEVKLIKSHFEENEEGNQISIQESEFQSIKMKY